MKPEVYWGLPPDEELVPLFQSRGRASAILGVPESAVRAYIDDSGVVVPGRFFRQGMREAACIQHFLLPELHDLGELSPPSEGTRLLALDDLFLYIEDPIEGDFAAHMVKVLQPVMLAAGQCLEEVIGGMPRLKRQLVYLSIFEHARNAKVSEVGPAALVTPYSRLHWVTSRSQAGIGTSVRRFKLYWQRFFDWHRAQYREDSGLCAVDLSYVDTLSPICSIAGFLLALRETQVARESTSA